jgi:hypothetical protein
VGEVHARCVVVTPARGVATPVPAGSWWYTVHEGPLDEEVVAAVAEAGQMAAISPVEATRSAVETPRNWWRPPLTVVARCRPLRRVSMRCRLPTATLGNGAPGHLLAPGRPRHDSPRFTSTAKPTLSWLSAAIGTMHP